MDIEMMSLIIIGITAMIGFFYLYRYTIDSYKENKEYKKIALGLIGSGLLFSLILFIFTSFFWLPPSSIFCFSLFMLFIVANPALILLVYYSKEFYCEYKKDEDSGRFRRRISVIIVIAVILISSQYVVAEVAFTPEGEQMFMLSLEKHDSSEIELMIPNLKSEDGYFDPEDYKITKGEGKVTGHDRNEYIRIITSSSHFQIEYHEYSKPFSDYNEKWDFPFDKLNETEHEETDNMNLQYFSKTNTSCQLHLEWIDKYDFTWGGHNHRIEANNEIDNDTDKIAVEVERSVV